MGFLKNLFGKKEEQEESFADKELKKEKKNNYKKENNKSTFSSSSNFSDGKKENIFENLNIDLENFGEKDVLNIEKILNLAMKSLEDGSETKEKLREKINNKDFDISNIRVIKDGNYSIKKVIKNGKVVQSTEEKTGNLNDDAIEEINETITNIFKKI